MLPINQYNKMQTENVSENQGTCICSNCVGLKAGEILYLT